MDQSLLFGNIRNHEEIKILHKEVMSDTHNDRSVSLCSNNSPLNSDSDFFDESDGEPLIVKCYISRSTRNLSGPEYFH